MDKIDTTCHLLSLLDNAYPGSRDAQHLAENACEKQKAL